MHETSRPLMLRLLLRVEAACGILILGGCRDELAPYLGNGEKGSYMIRDQDGEGRRPFGIPCPFLIAQLHDAAKCLYAVYRHADYITPTQSSGNR